MSEEESDLECSVCGHIGIPNNGCSTCHGNAPTQKRAFTLSEQVSGRVPEDQRSERYGRDGAVGPKIVNLPGSGGPGGGI